MTHPSRSKKWQQCKLALGTTTTIYLYFHRWLPLILSFHNKKLQFVLIQGIIQSIFAVLVYKFIIQQRGTVSAYLIGWGFIIPSSLLIPFLLLEYFDLQNRVINLAASTIMTCIFFRCVEAMYGTSPELVESSLTAYVTYYGSVVPYIWDPKTKRPKPPTGMEILSFLAEVLVYFTFLSLVLSYLMHVDFRPFESSVPLNKIELSLDIFSPAHIGNCYIYARKLFF